MAKFKFKLDSLKKYREHKLLVAKRDLAVVGAHLQQLKDRKIRSQEERKEMLGAEAMMYVSLVASETDRIRNLEKDLIRVEDEYERHRDWVAHLNRELRAVEKLEENQKSEFDADIMRKEKRVSDDWVSSRWPILKKAAEGGA